MMTSKITLSGNDLHHIADALELSIATCIDAMTRDDCEPSILMVGAYQVHCWKNTLGKIRTMIKEIDGANGGDGMHQMPNADDGSEGGTANGKSVRSESTSGPGNHSPVP